MTYKVKYIQRNGYLLIYRPKHHRASTDGYVYQHILVAEKGLGRKLRSDEVVHHLNFNRADNTSANLLVLTEEQHIRLHVWLRSGAPVGFRIYNKDQELVAFYDLRIRDNVPNANGIWFPVAGFKRDPEVTPENTPRQTAEEKGVEAFINACYLGNIDE